MKLAWKHLLLSLTLIVLLTVGTIVIVEEQERQPEFDPGFSEVAVRTTRVISIPLENGNKKLHIEMTWQRADHVIESYADWGDPTTEFFRYDSKTKTLYSSFDSEFPNIAYAIIYASSSYSEQNSISSVRSVLAEQGKSNFCEIKEASLFQGTALEHGSYEIYPKVGVEAGICGFLNYFFVRDGIVLLWSWRPVEPFYPYITDIRVFR